jgi:hypothetical protein
LKIIVPIDLILIEVVDVSFDLSLQGDCLLDLLFLYIRFSRAYLLLKKHFFVLQASDAHSIKDDV